MELQIKKQTLPVNEIVLDSQTEQPLECDVLLPDYAMDGVNEVLVYVFSAALGTSILVILFKLISIPFKGRRN